MDKDILGQTFRELRQNRHISLKQVAHDELSISQLSRFERGESELSITKFLSALKQIHVEVKEFMDIASGHQHSQQKRFMNQLIDLEYRRDITGFRHMQNQQQLLFKEHPDQERYKLNSILLQGFICKCDPTITFPKADLDYITDYLFATEHWNVYELVLIGNLYLFIQTDLLHRMGQEILKRKAYYQEINTHKHIVTMTILNIWETCIHRKELVIAAFYKEKVATLIQNETKLYEKTIFLFLSGLQEFQAGQTLTGIEQMRQAIQIFDWLGCSHMVDNYTTDFERFVK